MKEYRIDAKIRNNLILRRIESMGYKTIAEFCRDYSFSNGAIGDLVNLKEKAICSNSTKFRPIVKKLAEILSCEPEYLFTEDQKIMEIKSNKKIIEMEEKQIKYISDNPGYLLENMYPEKLIYENDSKKVTDDAMSFLDENQKKVIEMRVFEDKTLKEISQNLGLTTERIRQIESKAFRKLRSFFERRGLKFEDYLGMR